MPTETIECIKDKTTKRLQRFQVGAYGDTITGMLYVPQGTNKVTITVVYE